jgi:hypothetical protein
MLSRNKISVKTQAGIPSIQLTVSTALSRQFMGFGFHLPKKMVQMAREFLGKL